MADISKFKLPNGSEYDLVSKKTRGIYRGQMESTSTATAFTVTIDGITEYYDGLTLSIRNPVITSAANCTLNVNNLGAKRIWASQQNTFVSTSILKGAQFLFTYDGINDRWIKQQGTQTTNSNTVGEYAGSCLAGPFGMARYCLIMKVDDQHWESLVKTSGTGTSKEKNLHGFLLRSPILYQSGSTYTQGKLAGQSSCWSTASFDTRYSTNAGSFSTAGKSFYLVGTIVDEEYFYLSDTWWTNSLPNEEDGKVYIYIGQMYSTYQCTLAPKHPIYIYKNNELIQLIVPSDGSLIKNIPVNSTKKKQGSICSFFDSVGELPLKSLTVGIDPVQDLHGYDNPWPAGGGANLRSGLDFANDVKGRISSAVIDETEKTVSFAYNNTQTTDHFPNIAYKENTQYTLFIVGKNPTIARSNLRLYYTDGTYTNVADFSAVDTKETKLIVSDVNKTVASLAKTSNGGTTVLYYDECGVFEGVLTADQFTPYSNICPISGWAESNVWKGGKNLLNSNYSAYQIGNSYTYMNGVVPEGQTARFTFIDKDTSVDVSDVSIGFQNGVSLNHGATAYNWAVRSGNIQSNVTNVKSGVACSGVFIYPNTKAAFDALFSRWDIMVELGTTATDYEPYHGTSITIDFDRTVYGGVLDVLSGVLKINRVMVDLGAFEWSKYTGGTNLPVFYTSTDVSNMKPSAGDNAKCSIYRCQSWTNLNARIDKSVEIHPTIGRPYIADSAYTDAQTFKTAMDGVQLVYELTAPIEITLDPHEVSSLLGSNTIYADTGNTSIEYIANNGVIIPDASLTRPGLMTISDKEKINQINDIYEEIDNTKNHIIFSKTQPVNQQDGDIWMVLSEKTISLSSAETEVF